MNDLLRLMPVLFFAGVVVLFFFPWALGRVANVFRRRKPKTDEATLLLSTVSDVVSGIRESESDLRDLYSRAERKVSFLARYHQGILESMKTGVLACNRRGEVTACNAAAVKSLSLWRDDLRGTLLVELVGVDHICSRTFDRAVRGEPVEDRIEWKWEAPGEEPRWVEVRTSILYGKSGQPVGVTFLLDDVTERKILRERVELKERLAAMGEISAGIAHEFRNALHALNGLSRLIGRRAAGDERIEPLAKEILGETARMERILHELRLFVKPSLSVREPVEPARLVRSVLMPFVENRSKQPVQIRLALAPDLPRFPADKTHLAQALRNLVRNALQAMDEGGGTLTVGVAREKSGSGGRENLRITVSDTGPGIDAKVREKIFTPFFTTRPDGTGLGLPLVQNVATAHGGTVEVESPPGGGALFSLVLPLPAGTGPAGAPEKRGPAAHAGRRSSDH